MTDDRLSVRLDDYYTRAYDEHARLVRSLKGQLEYVRTQELVRAHLAEGAPHTIADIGGGTGIHAQWLAAEGHKVRMCDLNEKHVATALEQGVDAVQADALALPWENWTHDAALLAGPLYHLKEREERVHALAEAVRVCTPGSPVMVAALNRWAPLLGRATAGVVSGHEEDLMAIAADGRSDGAQGWPGVAYYHTVEGLSSEMDDAGLVDLRVYGLNGPGAWLGVAADRFFPRGGDGVPGWEFLEDAVRAARVADSIPGGQVMSSLFFAVGTAA